MGPVDYVVLGWTGDRPQGAEVAPMILNLVERGIILFLDMPFASKAEQRAVTALDLGLLGPDSPFAAFEGASSGLLDFGDVQEAAEALEPGTSAAILVWENRWAAPVAVAVRESGGL